VDDPFGYALAIEVRHFFEKVIVLQRRRAPFADSTQIAIVANRMTLPRCEDAFYVHESLLKK
jgi:hypothetical protein